MPPPPARTRATASALALGLLTATVPARSQTTPDPKGPPMSAAAIQSVIDANTAAVAARDMGAILGTYEAGAVMVTGPGMTAEGTDALADGFARFLSLDPRITAPRHEAVVAGDIALHLYPWTMTGRAPDGTAITQSGLSVIVLRRQSDGQWQIAIDHPFGDRLLRPE